MQDVGILVEAFKSEYDVFNTHSSSKKLSEADFET